MRLFSTVSKGLSRSVNLRTPRINNLAAVNIWGPGYKIQNPILDKEGRPILDEDGAAKKRVFFVPTTTYGLALRLLRARCLNEEEFELHKKDVSPGHVSLMMPGKDYLSIGAESLEDVGFLSSHRLRFSREFTRDVVGMGRFPEHQFDYYSLDCVLMDKFIKDFKQSGREYNLLGRFHVAQQEDMTDNCVSVVHAALLSGGIYQLCPITDRFLSECVASTAFTPAVYVDLLRSAYLEEANMYTQVQVFRSEFKSSMKKIREGLDAASPDYSLGRFEPDEDESSPTPK